MPGEAKLYSEEVAQVGQDDRHSVSDMECPSSVKTEPTPQE
jgi:hypothetical protein